MGLIGTPVQNTSSDDLSGLDLDLPTQTPAERWKELASLAKQAMSASDMTARQEVNAYKEEYGTGVSTLIRIYNASGCTLTFLGEDHDSGRWDKYQPDNEILNGQWSVCLHVKKSGSATGSVGALAYTIDAEKFGGGKPVFLIAWETPYSGFNSGDCSVMSLEQYNSTSWQTIHDAANNDRDKGRSAPFGELVARYQTGQNSSPLFTAVVERA